VRARFAGLTPEGNPDAVGQFNHGHSGVVGSGYGTAFRGIVGPETVRQNEAANIENYDEEHNWPRRLSTWCSFHHPICRYNIEL
jgi:hypothetical protein